MPQWIALCLSLQFGPSGPPVVEARWGFGRYDQHRFLHLEAVAPARAAATLGLGRTDPTVPWGPMRQFLVCR